MHFEDHLADFVSEMRCNWRKFESFAWSYWLHDPEITDPENWGIYYTSNRDSGLLERTNALSIASVLDPFLSSGDLHSESHGHWACGYVNGYSFRVVDSDGNPTRVCKALCEIVLALENYPILEEDLYSQAESEAAFENVRNEIRNMLREGFDLDESADAVISFLYDNDPGEMENRDDHGAYPSDAALRNALGALRMLDSDA